MNIKKLLNEKAISMYRLSKLSGIPHATLSDICSGKTKIEKCTVETLYKLSTVLDVPIETFIEDYILETKREKSYEYGLPTYLQKDLDAYKDGVKSGSSLIDCLWCELYGSINIAEINERAITPEHAEYLRNKFLRS